MHASSTSPIGGLVSNLTSFFSTTPEIKSDLAHNKRGTEDKILRSTRGFVNGWYAAHHDRIVFDKSRGWNNNGLALQELWPDAKLIVCVRHLCGIAASLERQHRRFPMLDEAESPQAKSIWARMTRAFSPDGMIGISVVGVEDLIRRGLENVVVIKFEKLVANPGEVMRGVYDAIGVPYFDHNFESVENTATDLDALYINKYPHEGSGRVQPPGYEFSDYIAPELQREITNMYPGYNQAFGYA